MWSAVLEYRIAGVAVRTMARAESILDVAPFFIPAITNTNPREDFIHYEKV